MSTVGEVTVTAAPAKSVRSDTVYDSAARLAPVRGALLDIYRYRGLVKLLVTRDLTVRYKRSMLGVTWTVLNPLLTSLVMWVIFNHLFHSAIPGHVPFLVYLLAGNLVATYFQQGISMTSVSLSTSASMLTKVYVPPVVFAFSTACGGAINFVFGLLPLYAFQLAFGVGISWTAILTPLPLLFMLAMIAGIGLFLSTFAIRFDDIVNLMNVVLVLVTYLAAVFYPVTIIPAHFRRLLYLNPLYPYVNVFRYVEYGGAMPSWINFVEIALTGVVGLAVGLAVFVRRWPTVAALL